MNKLEPYVEYHGFVLLKNSVDSHSTGLKSQFRLRNEDDLDVFKGITKRRKGHAGQIYRMHFRPITDEEFRITDVFFLGATWSHTNGTVVAFEFCAKQEWQEFREWPALSQGKDVEAQEIEIVLFKVGDNGELINLAQRDRIEAINEMKGGAQSIRCARLTTDGEFKHWVALMVNKDRNMMVSDEFLAQWVKDRCGIKSRKELDNDPKALENFNVLIMSPFNRWRG
jgi:hypothetical protein